MCAPDPPNPYATASAQTGQNISTATANSWLNNVNTHGPNGSVDYSQNGTHPVWDPNKDGEGKGGYRQVPSFTQTTTLSPTGQKIFDAGNDAKLNLAETGAERSAWLQNYLRKPAAYTDNSHTKWALNLFDKVNGKHVSTDRQALESNLANQGIQLGSRAYKDALGGFNTSQEDARNKFLLDSYGQGENTFRANRAAPLNEIISILNGSQIQVPNAPSPVNSNIQTTDLAGLIQDNFKAKLGKHQDLMRGLGQLSGGLFGLFGGL